MGGGTGLLEFCLTKSLSVPIPSLLRPKIFSSTAVSALPPEYSINYHITIPRSIKAQRLLDKSPPTTLQNTPQNGWRQRKSPLRR